MSRFSSLKFAVAPMILVGASLAASPKARADLDVFPNWVVFSSVPVGSSQTRSVTIRNTGSDWVSRVDLWEHGDTDQFRVDDFGCWGLNRFSSCSVRIEYSPTEAGHHSMRIDVSGGFGGSFDYIDVQGDSYERPQR